MRRPKWLEEPPTPLAKRFKRMGLLLFVVVAIWNLFSFTQYTYLDTATRQLENEQLTNELLADDRLENNQQTNDQLTNDQLANDEQANNDDDKPDNSKLDEVDETGLSRYDRSLNLEFCGRKVCKWLFVYSQNEQESRANKWFRVWNAAAEQMDRIVVLPHVGSSHIRSCMSKPFDFYYDVEDMERRYPAVTFVHQDRFVEWAKRRRQVATMRFMSIEIDPKLSLENKELAWTYRPLDMAWVKKRSCMKDIPLQTDPSSLNMTYVSLPDRWWRTMRHKIRADLLSSIHASDADVLMIHHGNVNPDIWPGSDSEPLKYASHIYEAANRLTEKFLRPFVAVHWRMENSTYENLPVCAQEMVDWLPKYAAERGIDRIYIATDFPIMGGANAQSTSWHKLPKPSVQAFEVVKNSLPFETWISVLDKYSKQNGDDLAELQDGVQSIIDKLVCENADYFVTPPQVCRKPYSNWTRAVVAERKKKAAADDPNAEAEIAEMRSTPMRKDCKPKRHALT